MSESRPTISTHVLDTATGQPAVGVRVTLHRLARTPADPAAPADPADSAGSADSADPTDFAAQSADPADPTASADLLADATTDADGRIRDLLGGAPLEPGRYRLTFDVARARHDAFFTRATLDIDIRDASRSYHVPLLLAPFGMTTYRGS